MSLISSSPCNPKPCTLDEQITDDDLRNVEAKGTNMYGEKLEGPAAEFRRRKLDADAKVSPFLLLPPHRMRPQVAPTTSRGGLVLV